MLKRKRHNHRNLKIWQLGTEIMKDIYDITSNFPKKEDYRLTSQLTGSAVSMPSNIAEGSARTDRAFLHYLDISLGSSYELGTQLIAAQHANYISDDEYKRINDKNTEFQRMTQGFIETIEV